MSTLVLALIITVIVAAVIAFYALIPSPEPFDWG